MADPPHGPLNLRTLSLPVSLAGRIPADFARKHRLVPLEETPAQLVVAAAPPVDAQAIDQLGLLVGKPIEVVEAEFAEDIEVAQERLWGRPRMEKRGPEVSDLPGSDRALADAITDAAFRIGGDADAPAVRAVTEMLARAVRDGASDVHIERYRDVPVVRERVDGILHDVPAPPAETLPAVVARIKALAHLRLDETRRPQDGQFSTTIHGREVDVRVSVIPALHGEAVVMRLLDRASVRFDLEALGFPPDALGAWRRLAALPHGLILVTGPTGSGKTTTLYATLQEARTPERKVVTVEDPVEYEFDGIVQAAVHPKTMTFAEGLRAYLRHDPDVILVGETRDPETAKTAIQAALTGHLVFTTLHTNDAVSAAARLIEMGVEPYLLADALVGVLAQRLVRVVCDACAREVPAADGPHAAAAAALDIPPTTPIHRGAGCQRCLRTGYRGRTGIYELMGVSAKVKDAIASGLGIGAIETATSYRRLADDGRAKVEAGVTTPEEVMRVARQG